MNASHAAYHAAAEISDPPTDWDYLREQAERAMKDLCLWCDRPEEFCPYKTEPDPDDPGRDYCSLFETAEES